MAKIAILPGDGIGPEIIRATIDVLEGIATQFNHKFEYIYDDVGGAAIKKYGSPLIKKTIDLCRSCDAVLLGAVGDPAYDTLPAEQRPEKAILQLRKSLGLFANLRPACLFNTLIDSSPLKRETIADIDLMVVRELTSGIYFGEPRQRIAAGVEIKALDTMIYTNWEIERIARTAFELAQKRHKKVTSVDKANVLESSRLWREMVNKVAKDYPEIELQHMYVDNTAMQLIKNPRQFDVLLTGNMFGDILSDEAAMLTGSLGMLASASLGSNTPGLFEPAHGSAPDIAGKNTANPIATIMSASLMLDYGLHMKPEAAAIRQAVEMTLQQGYRTQDIFSKEMTCIGTIEMGQRVKENLSNIPHVS